MDLTLITQLRRDLDAARYSLSSLTTLWGRSAEDARLRGVFPPAVRALTEREPSALATLARLFLLGVTVSRDELAAAVPSLGCAGAVALGLVVEDAPGRFRAVLSLTPVSIPLPESGEGTLAPEGPAPRVSVDDAPEPVEWWILSDLDDALRDGPARPDHVMGVGGATRTLLAQVPPRPVTNALDLGTGCGIVGLYLLKLGAQRVVATDISDRALAFARANAALNGFAGRLELRLGSLFEPVLGEQFDLIVSNPPFVITPRGDDEATRYDYRDGGMTGDDLAATVVRSAPAYLANQGSLVCLANWETPWGGHGLERVSGWVRAAGEAHRVALDAWVIERDRVDTTQYAETWARDGGARPGSAEFDALLTLWLDDFARRRIVTVGLGAIHVNKLGASGHSSAPEQTVVHAEQATGALAESGLGSALQQAFREGAAAERASDAQVLDTRWVRSDAVVEERIHIPGEESPSALTLVIDRPIARRVVADTLLAAAVGVCDGELTLRQIAGALASLLEIDEGAAEEALVAGVRELTWLGALTAE